MNRTLDAHPVSFSEQRPKAVSLASNLASCAVSGLLLTATLSATMAVAALLSLARVF